MISRQYYRAAGVRSAIAALEKHKLSHPVLIAGGTDLMLQLEKGSIHTDLLVDISQVRELKRIRVRGNEVCIGSAATFSEIIESSLLQETLPILVDASRQVGAPQIRNMGTIGGNVCTASGAADLVPCLVALDASVILAGSQGERSLQIREFIRGNRRTLLEPGELLKEIRIRKMEKFSAAAFTKMGLRASQAISVVNAAVLLAVRKTVITEAVIVVGCAGPKAVLCQNASNRLIGIPPSERAFQLAGEDALQELAPMDDIRGSAAFRNHLAAVLVARTLEQAYTRILQSKDTS